MDFAPPLVRSGANVLGKYRIIDEIGHGSFGKIFTAEDKTTHEFVALKVEQINAKYPQLEFEYKTYMRFTNTTNIPNVYNFGSDSSYRYLSMELLGKSLEYWYEKRKQPFTLKTVLMLADQMLASIEYIHQKGLIHRDIKPDNFVMGMGNKANTIHMIDFGLSKLYKDVDTGRHKRMREGLSLIGTARYASINALRGIEQSRRDDMESLGYVLIYLLKGSLPWQGLPAETIEQKNAKILEVKIRTPLEVLCNGLPAEFIQYLNEVRSLDYEDEPNYKGYRMMFRNLFMRNEFVYDYVYDWSNTVVTPPSAPRKPSTVPNSPRYPHQKVYHHLPTLSHNIEHANRENNNFQSPPPRIAEKFCSPSPRYRPTTTPKVPKAKTPRNYLMRRNAYGVLVDPIHHLIQQSP